MRHIVKEAVRLLDLALLPCHQREVPELFDTERCARMLGAFESNLLSVEVECPAIKQLRQQPHSSQSEPEPQLQKRAMGKAETSSYASLYPRELLARTSEAVARASIIAAAAGDAMFSNKQTKTMRHGWTHRRAPEICSGDDDSLPMLSSSWPCSEGVGL